MSVWKKLFGGGKTSDSETDSGAGASCPTGPPRSGWVHVASRRWFSFLCRDIARYDFRHKHNKHFAGHFGSATFDLGHCLIVMTWESEAFESKPRAHLSFDWIRKCSPRWYRKLTLWIMLPLFIALVSSRYFGL